MAEVSTPIGFVKPESCPQIEARSETEQSQSHNSSDSGDDQQKTSEEANTPTTRKRNPSDLTISSPTQKNHKRTPSEASRITYLSDLVREKEEDDKKQSVYSTPEELHPPGEVLAGKRTSIVGREKPRPVSQIGGALATGMGVGMVIGMSQGEVGR